MAEEENKYIAGKKNALATKMARKVWLEDKIRVYQSEAEEIRVSAISDQKVIETLVELNGQLKHRKEALSRARSLMASLEDDDVDVALEAYLKAKAEVEEIEAKMRLKYYAK